MNSLSLRIAQKSHKSFCRSLTFRHMTNYYIANSFVKVASITFELHNSHFYIVTVIEQTREREENDLKEETKKNDRNFDLTQQQNSSRFCFHVYTISFCLFYRIANN